jgi:hypothetical protein
MRLWRLLLCVQACIASVASPSDQISTGDNRKQCTVTPLGGKQDDVPNILKAFKECNEGGTVVFPEKMDFWIASKLNPVVRDVNVEWRGRWTVGLALYQPFQKSAAHRRTRVALRRPRTLAEAFFDLRSTLPKPPRLFHHLWQPNSHQWIPHRRYKRQR